MDAELLHRALLSPSAWPGPPAEVGLIETHVSRLYFVGARVYKVKKAVRLPFLDATELDRRRFLCEEELRLNRRLAPDTYLRVAPIRRDAHGRVALDGDGAVVEWAVEMERLPEQGMLDGKLERGELDNALLREVAVLLARFHASARDGAQLAAFGAPDAIARNALENLSALEDPASARVAPPRVVAYLRERTERDLLRLRPVFERRMAEGRVRDGHGDLHAGNLCVTERGLVAYDCVEFAARYRCGDVASDLAFLAMDLDLRGFRGFSGVLARMYAELAGDEGLAEVLPFYKGYRALVRAKVAALRMGQLGAEPARAAARADAQRHVALAASYTLPAALILTCGLPASGKTWVARHVARPFEALRLSSDVRRKLLAQVPLTVRRGEPYGTGLYAPELKERTYGALLDDARAALSQGRSVVVDAMFPSPERRAPFAALARELGAPLVVVTARASEAEVRRRMESRAADPNEVSDADWGIYERARSAFAEPDEFPDVQRVEHASGVQTGEEAALAVVERIVEQRTT